ncbi:MAG: nucleoside triphosphate pyrophosphohydrolase [candidate division WOR-3 bacterium]|nr:MAG: nucleoside triphosphate pyrophosphohydrolase [candidate division WOR-3 bacterium]
MKLDELIDLVKTLREKCPWDRAQTIDTLKNKVIEESYELVDAISENRTEAIVEEIGDVLFLSLFLARILEEEGRTKLDVLINSALEKYRKKHPHVFESKDLKDAHEVLEFWHKSKGDIFAGIPEILPALLAAKVIQERAARVGFDWDTRSGPLEKVREEVGELEKSEEAARGEELGDLLFACVNLARHMGVDPEEALRSANRKFVRRFRKVLEVLKKQGKDLDKAGLVEMDAIWDGLKKEE